MLHKDFAAVITAARRVLPDDVSVVSDDGFFQPRAVDGRWNGLFGFECEVLTRVGRATGDTSLCRLADFHRGKYAQWSSRKPHKRQQETFAEFIARDGRPVVLRVGHRARFVEVDSTAL